MLILVVCARIVGFYMDRQDGSMCTKEHKEYVYRELRGTMEDLITLEGLEEVERKLGIVVIGIRHTGIENVHEGP